MVDKCFTATCPAQKTGDIFLSFKKIDGESALKKLNDEPFPEKNDRCYDINFHLGDLTMKLPSEDAFL